MRHLTVRDVMTTAVLKARPTTPFKELARILSEHRVNALPIVDAEDHLVGVVSEADLLPKQQEPGATWRRWMSRRRRAFVRRAWGDNAGHVMTTTPATIDPEATLAEAAQRMAERHIKWLPVVDLKGTLVGVVTRADLIKVFVRSDDDIRGEVLREVFVRVLWADPQLLQIAVNDGIVTLSGTVEQKNTVETAEWLTRRVDGVVDVINNLTYLIGDEDHARR